MVSGLLDLSIEALTISIRLVSRAIPMACLNLPSPKHCSNLRLTMDSIRGSITMPSCFFSEMATRCSVYVSMHLWTKVCTYLFSLTMSNLLPASRASLKASSYSSRWKKTLEPTEAASVFSGKLSSSASDSILGSASEISCH